MRHLVMLSKRYPNVVTVVFLIAAAASFVEQTYVGGRAYGLAVGRALSLLILLSVLGALLPSIIRTARLRALEWRPATIAFAAFLAAELIWRCLLAPSVDVSKIASAVITVGEPAIAALGVAAVVAEWSRHRRVSIQPNHGLSVQQ